MSYCIKAFKYLFFVCFGLFSYAFAEEIQSNSSDTLINGSKRGKSFLNQDVFLNSKKQNPLVCAGLSAILPGSGQFYTKNYFPGVMFLGAEIIMGFAAYNNFLKYDYQRNVANILKDSLNNKTFLISQYTELSMKLDFSNFKRESKRVDYMQTLTWATSCYYFNIMSALDHSGAFYTTDPKKPVIAGWLSAVPFLGLGQIYSGSLKKAGMLSMIQVSLAVLSYNNQILMQSCENRLAIMADTTSPENVYKSTYSPQWDSERRNAFQKRNTYLWYSVLFYFYGVFDAVVDAHLHDVKRKLTLEPDLSILDERAGLKVSLDF